MGFVQFTYARNEATDASDVDILIDRIFIEDRAYFNAVSMCILQIGEIANSLSSEFCEETKEQMPWGMIHGMRNWLAHAYSEMDESIIWETAINDTPRLLSFCENILSSEKIK